MNIGVILPSVSVLCFLLSFEVLSSSCSPSHVIHLPSSCLPWPRLFCALVPSWLNSPGLRQSILLSPGEGWGRILILDGAARLSKLNELMNWTLFLVVFFHRVKLLRWRRLDLSKRVAGDSWRNTCWFCSPGRNILFFSSCENRMADLAEGFIFHFLTDRFEP